MWFYSQSTGLLQHSISATLTSVAVGYSGAGNGKNNPLKQNIKYIGPCPRGVFTFGHPISSSEHGPYAMPLEPRADNNMEGRDGFMCHGDSILHPGCASQGCIILPINIRVQIWDSGDHDLTVTQ